MNKLFTKIAGVFLGLAMTVGVGVVASQTGAKAVTVYAANQSLNSNWQEVTSTAGLNTTDKYVIATNDGNKFLNETLKKGHFQVTAFTASTPSDSAAGVFKLVSIKKDTYALQSVDSSDYVTATAASSGKGSMANSDTNGWLFSYSSGWSAVYQKSGAQAHLRSYNNNSFRTYANDDNGDKIKIYRYAASYIVSFDNGGGSGSMAPVSASGSYTLPTCTFTAPSGKEFDCWSVGGIRKNAGETISVTANVTVTALWKDLPTDPYVHLILTSGSTGYTGDTVTVTATSGHLLGTGLAWTVSPAAGVTNITSDNSGFSGTLATAGTVTITATDNGGTASDNVSITVTAVNYFSKVTDTAELFNGQQIMIAASATPTSVMSAEQAKNNRVKVNISEKTGRIYDLNAKPVAAVFTLGIEEMSDGKVVYTFHDSNGYLYAAGSPDDKNYLRSQTENDNYGRFTIAISDGDAAVVAIGADTHNTLRYNSASSLFSCYSSGQAAISIYKGSVAPTALQEAQTFTTKFMKMNSYGVGGAEGSTAGNGACKGEQGYYAKAKVALVASSTLISEFKDNDVFNDSQARYEAWALACGDSTPYALGPNNEVIVQASLSSLFNASSDSNNTALVIVVSLTSLSAIGGYFLIRRRKEN